MNGVRKPYQSGSGRFCTAAAPGRGLGFAPKIDDSAKCASQVATGAVLRYLNLLDDEAIDRLTDFIEPRLQNWRGREVGAVRPAAGWLPELKQ